MVEIVTHLLPSPLPQAVSSLMTEMSAVLELHSSSAVLEAAARTFLSLCGEETAWCSVARTTRDSLVQRWVDQLTALLNDSIQVRLRTRIKRVGNVWDGGMSHSSAFEERRASLNKMTCCVLSLCLRVTVFLLMRGKLAKF